MQHIKLVFESLCRALIRFFDNRSIKDDNVEWYRMELEKSHAETQSLIQHLLMPRVVTPEIQEEQDFKPLGNSQFKSWNQKRRELEAASYKKAQDLAAEAQSAINASRNAKKTTEQLEEELLDGTD